MLPAVPPVLNCTLGAFLPNMEWKIAVSTPGAARTRGHAACARHLRGCHHPVFVFVLFFFKGCGKRGTAAVTPERNNASPGPERDVPALGVMLTPGAGGRIVKCPELEGEMLAVGKQRGRGHPAPVLRDRVTCFGEGSESR